MKPFSQGISRFGTPDGAAYKQGFANVKTGVVLLVIVIGLCSCSRSTNSGADSSTLIVKVLKKPLPGPEDKRKKFLVRTFFKEERKFSSYTTDNWKSNFTAFATVLVRKAQDQKLDSASLRRVLDLVLQESEERIAYLPISAYQTTLNGSLVWIVVVKWEYPAMDSSDGGQREPLSMGHIRAFGFDQKTLKQVAFMTCG